MKIPQKVILALAKYYGNRQRQKLCMCEKCGQRMPDKTFVWDKDADIRTIGEACEKHEIGWYAIAGTFWFNKGKQSVELDESNYLNQK